MVAAQACILISIKDNCEKQFLHYHWRTCFELLDVDGSKTITVREREPTRPSAACAGTVPISRESYHPRAAGADDSGDAAVACRVCTQRRQTRVCVVKPEF